MPPDPWGENHDFEGDQVELNLTSLVDVVFALLIVFMVSSAAMVEQWRADASGGQIELSLPTGQAQIADPAKAELVVTVDVDGSLYQDGQATDARTLAKAVAERLGKQPDLQVRLEADQKLTYQRVMDVIGELQQLGVRNVGLATRKGGGGGDGP